MFCQNSSAFNNKIRFRVLYLDHVASVVSEYPSDLVLDPEFLEDTKQLVPDIDSRVLAVKLTAR